MKKAYVFLAEGFEEVEALTCVDILRRAGVNAVTVSVSGDNEVTGSHRIPVVADCMFADITDDADLLVLPGGMPGATNLRAHEGLCELLLKQEAEGRIVSAICASPAIVLGPLGLLKDREATCYPGMEGTLFCRETVKDKNVVVCNNVVTSRGPATAMDFALALTEALCGKEVKDKIAAGLLK
ncbi:MAG: DJ-1/PfpI family protein [Lachnospiraceae bacterium]|nr:DJ-1/PfpI family protein [Lachnospiraceae bacterium]